ncbi:MAG: hypothetical protein ACO1SV_26760 [Fimbriimonas sp.]
MVWLIAATALSPLFAGPSQVSSRPTGQNGYEEYIRAGALAAQPDIERWSNFVPNTPNQALPAGLKPNSSLLERNRWVLGRLKPAFELVRQGNQKPVADPRASVEIGTVFPEFAQFRRLSRAMAAASYAEFALGQTAQGTDHLLDGLTFGDNVSRTGTLIAHLVGLAQMSVAFGAFESRLPQLSQNDCRRIVAGTSGLLERPSAFAATLATERDLAVKGVDQLVVGEGDWLDEGEYKGLSQALKKLTPAQKSEVLRLTRIRIQQHFEKVIRQYLGPESQWPLNAPEPPVDDTVPPQTPENMAEVVAESLTPVFSQGGVASLRVRTQLRLLRLHAWVLGYRWEHDRLPSQLQDAVPSGAHIDPVNGEPFEYTMTPEGYRLVSTGRPGLGEVALRYRRPTTTPNQEQVPPR